MIALSKEQGVFARAAECLFIDEYAQVIVYKRGKAVFAFNFSPSNHYTDYYITVPTAGKYRVVFSTDEKEFGGFDRISKEYVYTAEKHPDGKYKFRIYMPARTALCIKKIWNTKAGG